MEKELALMKNHGVRLLSIRDRDYPKNLLQIYDPPPCLYLKGKIEDDDRLAVAIVGARRATPYGIKVAERISMELACQGFTIVSGMARGIDTAAHRGALKGGGRTIAVLGNGIDIIYPRENSKLFQDITFHGVVLSEFPMSTPPFPQNFPLRNRVISGLSLGTVVVEASVRSGSLITARFALEQGREVFAIPGSITSHTSQGTNKLIKEGAKLVEDTQDILDEILPQIKGTKRPYKEASVDESPKVILSPEEKGVLNSLSDEPKHIDAIIQESQLKANAVYPLLLNLQIKGLIQEHPGKYYTKRT